MNINKLFPRLTIRSKLGIAFAFLAIIPLLAVAGFATIVTVRYVRALTEATLRYDLDVARAQTERTLREVERQVAFLAGSVLGPRLGEPEAADWDAADSVVSGVFAVGPALFRVSVIGVSGRPLFASASEDLGVGALEPSEDGGLYYSQRANALQRGEHLVLPVELRSVGEGGDVAALPALAILEPVWRQDGTRAGVVVGELYASVLFEGLEAGSPSLPAVTGLVASGGLLLYHSQRKRDWASLLSSRVESDLETELSARGAAAVLSGQEGTLQVGDVIVTHAPLQLPGSGIGPLTLYRTTPLSALEAPVRSLQRGVAVGGLALLAFVLGLSVLATHQFTGPIYTLREGVSRLAQGGAPVPVIVETNDELEDLALDFSRMAEALAEHRDRLEELVVERTRALQEAHSELEDILEYSADAIAGLDVDGRVRVWNRGAEALFGYSASEAVGRHIDDLLLPAGPTFEAEAALIGRELERGGAVTNLQTARAPKGGEPFPVSLTQAPIHDDRGGTVGYSLIIRDNTLQSRLADQMRRSERLAAVSVMAAGLAHELKNPLGIIDNRIEWMMERLQGTQAHRALLEDAQVVREHSRRLIDLTRDLLAFAHEDTDLQADIALSEICGRVVGLLEHTFDQNAIALDVDLAADLPTLLGNTQAIETLCVNLLLNAMDATPAGGAVALSTGWSESGSELELDVKDTGPGIAADLRHRIFEPFFTTKGADRGTGLGLAVCRGIVERHGGRIRVEGEPGDGARFVVAFPVLETTAEWTNRES